MYGVYEIYKRGRETLRTPLKPIVCGAPWEVVSIDVTGQHPVSKEGYTWILTLQNHYSKWVEAFPLRRHTADVVAKVLFENVFLKFGSPLRILSDQGPEFESKLFHRLCELMQIDKIRTSPYHASGNGMLERYHRCLNTLLAKVVSKNQRDWPDHLNTVVAAYRATVHEATGMTPNRAFLGRDIRMPIDLVMGTNPESEILEGDGDFIETIRQRMQADGVLVRIRLGRAAEVMKKRYDARLSKPFELSVGQKVWYFYPRRYSKLSPKWQNLYTGPFKIIKFIDQCSVVIRKGRRGRIIIVHRDKL